MTWYFWLFLFFRWLFKQMKQQQINLDNKLWSLAVVYVERDDLVEPIVTTTTNTRTYTRKYAISNAWKCTIIPFLVYFFFDWSSDLITNSIYLLFCYFFLFIQFHVASSSYHIHNVVLYSSFFFVHTTYRKLKPIHKLCSLPH